MNSVVFDVLMHYGMKYRSGRYPYGSGEDPYQHDDDFLSTVEKYKQQGLTETEIAKAMGLSTTDYRAEKAVAKMFLRQQQIAQIKSLQADGLNNSEIARKMGFKNESSVRNLLNEEAERRRNAVIDVAEEIQKVVDEKGLIDVGAGVERELGISREKLDQSLHVLQMMGYEVYPSSVEQATNPGKRTHLLIVAPPGTEHKEAYDYSRINSLRDYTVREDADGKEYFDTFHYPASMDSSRIFIRYAEDGGKDLDGVIQIRPGVEDLSLGESRYSQVRILVDDNKYMKGMALYSNDIPDGYDVVFNTNKKSDVSKLDVLKDIKKDNPDNPFGALIKANGQSVYTDAEGNEKLSLINKTREESDWNEWSDTLPSQFLSKQKPQLIKSQLNLALAEKESELAEINALTNPTVKQVLLKSFADDCDHAAVHLYAAALPRQKYQVILPVSDLSDTEVYAPNYKDGEKIALIRYPHGGTFEIPILTVNNRHQSAKDILGNAADAVGINANVAERLSGADFDGDTVMVIPVNGRVNITSTKPLEGLKGFDPKVEYGGKEPGTFKQMTKAGTQKEMGVISNLITDMTIKNATPDELARAVRHSMVVIDAEKHHLDYKQSEVDNGIQALKEKYQLQYDENGRPHYGASTLISRAKSEERVLKQVGSPQIDPETGKISYKQVEEHYIDKYGKDQVRTTSSTKMAQTDDARTLSAGYLQEELYADYANKLKALANDARKEYIKREKIVYSASAKDIYAEEVQSLNAKLETAELNAPRERMAQVIANANASAIVKAYNQELTKKEKSKIYTQQLAKARVQVGAHRTTVDITPKEWEAIQAGAISSSKLLKILNKADIDKVREYATPREKKGLSVTQKQQIAALSAAGYTQSEIAERYGISAATVSKIVKGE